MTEQITLFGFAVILDDTMPKGTIRLTSGTSDHLKRYFQDLNFNWTQSVNDRIEYLNKELERYKEMAAKSLPDCYRIDTDKGYVDGVTTNKSGTSSSVVDGEVLEWTDTQEIRFDTSVHFGKGYDFFPWEYLRHELHTPLGSYAVWGRDSKWSVYGTKDGWMALDHFASEREARTAAEKSYLSDRVEQLEKQLANTLAPAPPIDRDMPEWVSKNLRDAPKLPNYGIGSSYAGLTIFQAAHYLADQLEARDREVAFLKEELGCCMHEWKTDGVRIESFSKMLSDVRSQLASAQEDSRYMDVLSRIGVKTHVSLMATENEADPDYVQQASVIVPVSEFSSCGYYRPTLREAVAAAIKDGHAAMQSSEQPSVGESLLEQAARKAYDHYTDNHPTIHSNRFEAWEDLSEPAKDEWRNKVAMQSSAEGK